MLKMKSTTYIAEITTQKNEKNISLRGESHLLPCLVACLFCVNKEIFCVSLLKSVLINQAVRFIFFLIGIHSMQG